MSYIQCTPYFRTFFEQIPPPSLPSPFQTLHQVFYFFFVKIAFLKKHIFFVGNEASYGPFCGFLLGLGDKLFLHLHLHKYGIFYEGVNVVQETTKILGHRAFQINTAQEISRCKVSECLSF